MSDVAAIVISAVAAICLMFWTAHIYWQDYLNTRRKYDDALDECVARALVGPDPSGRCRQCGLPVFGLDIAVAHVRLWHDRSRPRGPEDDPAFIASLTRDSDQES